MTSDARRITELLALEHAETNVFIGPASHERYIRAFGGQVLAQALLAAGLTAPPERAVNSLHGYFLRPGKPNAPIEYRVTPMRDGRSFSTRQVAAVQDNQVIYQMMASLHHLEVGLSHSLTMPDVAPPEELQPFDQRFAGREDHSDMGRWFTRASSFDIRYTGSTPFENSKPANQQRQRVWIKATEALPNDPLLHNAVAAYVSDMTILDAILLTHGVKWTDRKVIGASLDHSMWFHRPLSIDQWHLFDQYSPIAHGARGLAQGHIWSRNGELVATISQEALLRPPGN